MPLLTLPNMGQGEAMKCSSGVRTLFHQKTSSHKHGKRQWVGMVSNGSSSLFHWKYPQFSLPPFSDKHEQEHQSHFMMEQTTYFIWKCLTSLPCQPHSLVCLGRKMMGHSYPDQIIFSAWIFFRLPISNPKQGTSGHTRTPLIALHTDNGRVGLTIMLHQVSLNTLSIILQQGLIFSLKGWQKWQCEWLAPSLSIILPP